MRSASLSIFRIFASDCGHDFVESPSIGAAPSRMSAVSDGGSEVNLEAAAPDGDGNLSNVA